MTSSENPRLGWIGLGSMGLGMANNMQKHLKEKDMPSMRYWNRTLSRGEALQEIGGIPCQSIGDLVQNCDIIFISVSNDAVLTNIIDEITSSGPIPSKTIVDTTTVHPTTTSAVAAKLTAQNASYIAAPVFGASPLAIAGTLLIAVAGPDPAIQKTSPFLQGVIARAVIPVGPDPAQALLLKTTSNLITAGMTYLLSEAHTLAAKSGLPAAVLESLVEQNLGPYAHGVSRRLTSGAYFPPRGEEAMSGLELGIKDVAHGVGLAGEVGMRVRVGELYLEAAREAERVGRERGRGLDSSAVFGVVRVRAGLEFETEGVRVREGKGKE
ncbi:NAD(P)-binding protein [Dothidotthia symphoricarpi CBS 119687]|uniref:NAD(P)-binding protein n=1 Tax=Dothidotthia symphoricarpi CBS 119687 TaxID=1392245 RepID=A0A6A6AKK5_9PLEO|nr:NAD(P)-binding protein [Dothidotthia symphoricarpi CBS 119687]KAF2131444.1 NAD(P)-binding protein [Dothidotthia symphoricarpi CBS 119687]